MGIVRKQKIQVYVQQSRRRTFPLKLLTESGVEFAQIEMSLNSGAGMAGTRFNLSCLIRIRASDEN
jgi:hypothetical protein